MGQTWTKKAVRDDKAEKRRRGANYRFCDKRSARSNRRGITGRTLTNVALRNAGVITCRDSFSHLRLSHGRQIVAEPRRGQCWMYRSVNCERAKVSRSLRAHGLPPLINVSFKATTGRLAGSPESSLASCVFASFSPLLPSFLFVYSAFARSRVLSTL